MKQNILARKLPEIKDVPKSHRLSLLGPGCLIGEDDLMAKNSKFTCSVRCHSTRGTLLAILKDDFMRMIQYDNSMAAVRGNVEHKLSKRKCYDMPDYELVPNRTD